MASYNHRAVNASKFTPNPKGTLQGLPEHIQKSDDNYKRARRELGVMTPTLHSVKETLDVCAKVQLLHSNLISTIADLENETATLNLEKEALKKESDVLKNKVEKLEEQNLKEWLKLKAMVDALNEENSALKMEIEGMKLAFEEAGKEFRDIKEENEGLKFAIESIAKVNAEGGVGDDERIGVERWRREH